MSFETKGPSQNLKLANFEHDACKGTGIISEDLVLDISQMAGPLGIPELDVARTVEQILSMPSLLEKLVTSIANVNSKDVFQDGIPLNSVRILSPILSPEKIFLAAINYLSHSKEQEVKPAQEPYFFTKFRNCIVGHEAPVILPRMSKQADWEVELAVVIGKRGKYIPRIRAMDYIAGFTIANDISFRDLQFPLGWPARIGPLGQNWVKGKGLDSALPLGPYFVTKDEVKDIYNLSISLRVNGIVRQNSNTAEMVFKIDELVEYLSSGITLSPGDIISTGTPHGVAAFTGAPYLKSGDIVEATIDGLGTLRNTMKAEEI